MNDRFILLGTSIESRLLVVCHCVRVNDSIRIISARKADKQERAIYEGYRHA
ncbi:BrnT family toxin [Porticoccus sp. W117]|uniref:BrnT family toxin n=1 Tax=Porticoccus sp. W117 TaxID=3054777 RepID=UPI00338FD400